MTSNPVRFRYVDSGTNDVVIASTGGQGGVQLDRVKQGRDAFNTHKIVAWSTSTLFGEFPNDRTQFNSSEPEIFFEELISGSWEIQNRVFAKDSGTIRKKGSYKITLYGFQKYAQEQEVNISNTTTHIVDVAEKLAAELDSSYVIDAPDEVDVTGGYPSVDGYTYKGKAKGCMRELTKDFKSNGDNWVLNFTGQTDGSGNYIIRFEPKGYGNAVDTLDSNTNGLQFLNWKKERTDQIVNKVEVIGTNDAGESLTGTASNQTMINRYGVKFERYHREYLANQTEADNIAEQLLVPGLDSNGNDITETPESGKVSLPTLNFNNGVENDSFNIVDTDLDIDDTFTCVRQNLYYPAGKSELVFEFEKEGLEKAAEGEKNLGAERAKRYPSSQTDVGNQNVNADTEDVTDRYDDFGNDNHPHGNSDSTSDVGFIQVGTVDQANDTGFTISPGAVKEVTLNNFDFDGNLYAISASLETDEGYGQEVIAELEVKSIIVESFTTKLNNGGALHFTHTNAIETPPFDITFRIVNKSGSDIDVTGIGSVMDIDAYGEDSHDHNVPISDTDFNSTGGNNDTNPNDSTAGDTTSLNATGSTEGNVNVNTATEDKTDR